MSDLIPDAYSRWRRRYKHLDAYPMTMENRLRLESHLRLWGRPMTEQMADLAARCEVEDDLWEPPVRPQRAPRAIGRGR